MSRATVGRIDLEGGVCARFAPPWYDTNEDVNINYKEDVKMKT